MKKQGNSKLVLEITPCSQYFRSLVNENEPDPKQRRGHEWTIIPSRVFMHQSIPAVPIPPGPTPGH